MSYAYILIQCVSAKPTFETPKKGRHSFEYYKQKKKELKSAKNSVYYQEITKSKVRKDSERNKTTTKYATLKRNQREINKIKNDKDILRKIRKSELMRIYRTKQTQQQTHTAYTFKTRMEKSRAIKKLKMSLPDTPKRRVSTIAAYLSAHKQTQSPTIKTLEVMNIVRSPEDHDNDNMHKDVVEDIKHVLESTKRLRSTESNLTRKLIFAAVSGENVQEGKRKGKLANKLGVKRVNIAAGSRVRTRILTSEKSCWKLTEKKNRNNNIPNDHKRLAYNFWLSKGVSRPTANKKDIKRERLDSHVFVSHMIHILEKSQTEAYNEFCTAHPHVKMSQRTFERLKPFFVRPVRQGDRNTCLCRYHVEFKSVFESCMKQRKTILDLKNDGILSAKYPVYQRMNEAVQPTLCKTSVEQEHHKMECINRNCENCGIHGLLLLPEETAKEGCVEWEKFEYVTVAAKGKQVRKKLMLVTKKTTVGELFAYFLDLLSSFPAHQFRASWQNEQLKALTSNLPLNDVLCVHDFSENYRYMYINTCKPIMKMCNCTDNKSTIKLTRVYIRILIMDTIFHNCVCTVMLSELMSLFVSVDILL